MTILFSFLEPILSIADTPTDSQEIKRQHIFLIYMGLLMSLGGLLWGTLCILHELYLPAAIPFGYILITTLNFLFLYKTKNFAIAQNIQIFISLILPFFFQYFLGGFVASGGNVLWSVLAVFGSFTLRNKRASIIWLIHFVLIMILSGLTDPMAKEYDIGLSESYITFFFVINFILTVSIIFSLFYYFVSSEDSARKKLEDSLEELKFTQNKLIASEKMASLGALVSGVAHEINTPLGVGLSGVSQIRHEVTKIESNYKGEALTEEALVASIETILKLTQTINDRLINAVDLVKSFKSISVDQHFEDKREFHLKKYMDDLILSLQNHTKSKQVSINNTIDDSIVLNSFPGIFSQIVTNLILNSVVHAFENSEGNVIDLTTNIKDEDLIISYRDNGCGISDEIEKKIFDPFFTTKRGQGGSGLGMNIVYNLVTQKLDGSINIVKVSPHGLGFDIILTTSHIKA